MIAFTASVDPASIPLSMGVRFWMFLAERLAWRANKRLTTFVLLLMHARCKAVSCNGIQGQNLESLLL